MRRGLRHVGLLVALAALSPAPVSPAFAQAPRADKPAGAGPKPLSQSLTGAAKDDFEAGKLLASDGDFAGALIKFQSSYDASKDPRLLWNVAFCQKNLRHYSKVIATLKRYVEEGGASVSASDRKDAQDLIATIEPFTTRVTVRVSEPGAQVTIDDEVVGLSPLPGPVVLDIGERRLRVAKDGFRAAERALVVGGSAEATTEVVLERDVHEGKLMVDAPAGASIFVDENLAGQGKAEQTLGSGGHQLRVTAPGMRPFQTEVVIQDKETRQLSVTLETQAPAERPKLRVSVGCSDPEPRSPQDGLVVVADGTDVLPPGAVKRRTVTHSSRTVVDYVEYPVLPGRHVIRVTTTDCEPLETSVDVDPAGGASLAGVLPSDRLILVRGPEGSPGWYRAGLALWLPVGHMYAQPPEDYSANFADLAGVALDVGLVDRWFAAYLNAGYAAGVFHRKSFATHYALPSSATASWERLEVRAGPRFPFHSVSLGFGGSLGVEEVDLSQVLKGVPTGVVGGFAELDVQPLCDWGIFATAEIQAATAKNPNGPEGNAAFGVFYEPNPRCRRERGVAPGIRTSP